jgi:hypothetical protein
MSDIFNKRGNTTTTINEIRRIIDARMLNQMGKLER